MKNTFSGKISWCMQNFLTMEFYRKICNKCYWSNVYNSRHSVLTKLFILLISFSALMFFSFFYLPTDPANSHSASYLVRAVSFLLKFRLTVENTFNCISNSVIRLAFAFINLLQINLRSYDLLKLKTSLLI